jgi:hypothetical protein
MLCQHCDTVYWNPETRNPELCNLGVRISAKCGRQFATRQFASPVHFVLYPQSTIHNLQPARFETETDSGCGPRSFRELFRLTPLSLSLKNSEQN